MSNFSAQQSELFHIRLVPFRQFQRGLHITVFPFHYFSHILINFLSSTESPLPSFVHKSSSTISSTVFSRAQLTKNPTNETITENISHLRSPTMQVTKTSLLATGRDTCCSTTTTDTKGTSRFSSEM